jgi:hypothetical protein
MAGIGFDVTSARISAGCQVLHKIGVTFLELGTLRDM